MIYREYGTTGEKLSILGFGGMRFGDIENRKACVEMMVQAARGGVNYFDTAPRYFGTKSEEVFGEGLAELRRQKLPYFLSTKTFEATPEGVRQEVTAQLKRLKVDVIDFYHIWCLTSLANWQERKAQGVLEAFVRMKEEGLIRHICVSSHLIGDEIKTLLMENVFEGVLFGYSAYNFQTRQAAFDAIRKHRLGCVVMNPLGGGLIPQNPERFKFLQTQPGETVTQAALRFLFSHPDITVTLVGFSTREHVREALDAVERFDLLTPAQLDAVRYASRGGTEGICTGCQYCDGCPENIPIPMLMDAYNHKVLGGGDQDVLNRLKWHWNVAPDEAARCVDCARCEERCTQHLEVMRRLKEIAAMRVAD